jgi:predicted transcriptional regulator of viral defense system
MISKIKVIAEIRDLFEINVGEAKDITELFYDQACEIASRSERKRKLDRLWSYCCDEINYHKSMVLIAVDDNDLERAKEHSMMLGYYSQFRFDLQDLDSNELPEIKTREDFAKERLNA